MELIRMEDRRAKILSYVAGASTEVVEEIGEGGIACCGGVNNLPVKVSVGKLI
jgi:hypothetical protein